MQNQEPQTALFDRQKLDDENADLVPAILHAAERLTSPHEHDRRQGLSGIVDMGAHRHSPLIAYLLATRLTEPVLSLRFRVVKAVGDILRLNEDREPTPDQVRRHLQAYLSQMRRRQIYGLLQVADRYAAAEADVARILNMCSYAGGTLSGIFNDRNAPLSIRKQAIYYCGRVGFGDSLPAMERLVHRLQSKDERQTRMNFVPQAGSDREAELMVYARAAMEKLTNYAGRRD